MSSPTIKSTHPRREAIKLGVAGLGSMALLGCESAQSSIKTEAQVGASALIAIRIKQGLKDDAIKLFENRIFPECAEAVSGFLKGQVFTCVEDEGLVFVSSQWASPSDYHLWLESPVRTAQIKDLGDMALEMPIGGLSIKQVEFSRPG